MLSKVSEFATKTFLLWMFIAAIIGFISNSTSDDGSIRPMAIRNCDVRHGNDN